MMKAMALATVLTLALAGNMLAANVTLLSPETAQTWPYHGIADRSLRWNAKSRLLEAQITFTTEPYSPQSGQILRPETETYFFSFGRVDFDPQRDLFFVQSPGGDAVPVAVRHHTVFGPVIRLLPTSRAVICNDSGRIAVVLFGSDDPAQATHGSKWVERSRGCYLQNLVRKLLDPSGGFEAIRRF